MDFDLRAHTLLLVVAGSRAYGIHRPDSDVDMKGVAIPPVRYFHGYVSRFEQADSSSHMATFTGDLNDEERAVVLETKLEGSVYDIRKFVSLAADCNPSILDALFCRDEEVRVLTPLGRRLRENRDLFLSAKAKHTFSGYAASQMKRIKTHRQWLLSPIERQPTRGEFGLPEHTLIPADQLAAAQATVAKQVDRWEFDFTGMADSEIVNVQARISGVLADICAGLGYPTVEEGRWLSAARHVGLNDNLILVMQREREYEAAHRHWKQYQEWKTKRNPARAALEEKHGFDSKHGAHLARLLRMCREILETGKVNVWRGGIDAEEILAIRNGAWTYDRLVEWAQAEDDALTEIYKAGKYAVPKQPDRAAIDTLCVDLVETALREGVL